MPLQHHGEAAVVRGAFSVAISVEQHSARHSFIATALWQATRVSESLFCWLM